MTNAEINVWIAKCDADIAKIAASVSSPEVRRAIRATIVRR